MSQNGNGNGNGTQVTLPEAPASATAKIVNPKTQMEWLVTTRAATMGEVLDRFGHIEAWMEKHGYVSFDAYVDQRRAERAEQQSPPPAVSANGNGGRQPIATGDSRPHTFEAERLVGTVNGGKTYWKVQGGKFSKFGVTIWPEILADAGLNPDELNPMEQYPLTGYLAHFIYNDKGNPDKVVVLEQRN